MDVVSEAIDEAPVPEERDAAARDDVIQVMLLGPSHGSLLRNLFAKLRAKRAEGGAT